MLAKADQREAIMAIQRATHHPISSINITDLLEWGRDKGILIARDISVSLVSVELLTIQLRPVIYAVEKPRIGAPIIR
jgi:hypothetical protein